MSDNFVNAFNQINDSELGKDVKRAAMLGSAAYAYNLQGKYGKNPDRVGGVLPDPAHRNVGAVAGELSASYYFMKFFFLPLLLVVAAGVALPPIQWRWTKAEPTICWVDNHNGTMSEYTMGGEPFYESDYPGCRGIQSPTNSNVQGVPVAGSPAHLPLAIMWWIGTGLLGLWIMRGAFRLGYGRSVKSVERQRARKARRRATPSVNMMTGKAMPVPSKALQAAPAASQPVQGEVVPVLPRGGCYVLLDSKFQPVANPRNGVTYRYKSAEDARRDYQRGRWAAIQQGLTPPPWHLAYLDKDDNIVQCVLA